MQLFQLALGYVNKLKRERLSFSKTSAENGTKLRERDREKGNELTEKTHVCVIYKNSWCNMKKDIPIKGE